MASFFSQLSRPRSKFEENGSSFLNFLQREQRKQKNSTPTETLIREYQIKAVFSTKEHFDKFEGNNAPPALIVAPPGAGKSGMVAMIPYALQCRKVLIISPNKTISRQISEAFGHNPTVSSFLETVTTDVLCLDGIKNFLEPVTLIDSTNQVRHEKMGNAVIVNAQKFGGRSQTSLMQNDVEIVQNVKTYFQQFDTVIVDEAHHYPANTWKAIMKNFEDKKIVFLTATPFHSGRPILSNQKITFELKRIEIEGTTIRKCVFEEIPRLTPLDFANDQLFCKELYEKIQEGLKEHDELEPIVKHQAIILVRLVYDASCLAFSLNELHEDVADYDGSSFAVPIVSGMNTKTHAMVGSFNDGKYRVAIVCGMLLEGYDNSKISMCIILRNIHKSSKVLFNQFTGRCVRMSHFQDKVEAKILSYKNFKQRQLWDTRDELASVDPNEEEEEMVNIKEEKNTDSDEEESKVFNPKSGKDSPCPDLAKSSKQRDEEAPKKRKLEGPSKTLNSKSKKTRTPMTGVKISSQTSLQSSTSSDISSSSSSSSSFSTSSSSS